MFTKETAKKEVEHLVKKYELILKEGRIGEYNESNTRKDFILPLFSTLGWEIANINEVQEETRISRDRVDYSFNLVNIPKFYLEAKALKADLDKPEYAQQAIDYAYNKGVPWAVLTDFEKIKVFNAEWKAKTLTDSQFFELSYNEYISKFDQLWLLSKEAITQGFLDKEAERWGKKDKKQPISKQILADLLKAREKLTKNILKYPRLNKISEEELDESVQRILDRLIFIRTCEDRVIEQNHLLSAVRIWREKSGNLWEKLNKIFRDFDNGYNSKLFEKHFCEDLTLDDEVLAEIIENLYQTPDGSRYDFSAINADVLGNIYEQYLGHILKKTPKSARLKETRQHRKEMGIYYTPTYIVDYIVKNTLGELLKKAKPKQVMKIRVLDPACGSGSFLIRAFDEFVNYWQKHSPGEFGYFRKIEILKNNLYGVDLDKQAVEIAQMNLLLKTLYHRERLPMLEHIKQGNSLIDDPAIAGDKAFRWKEEFKEAMSEGGFDIVIGNPPYVFARGEKFSEQVKKYYYDNFELASYQLNTYLLFVNQAYKLLNDNGYFGFIIPNTWLTIDTFVGLRKFLLEETCNLRVINIYDKVFQEANVDNCLLLFKKGKANNVTLGEFREGKLEIIGKFLPSLFKSNNYIINIALAKSKNKMTILDKIKKNSKTLNTFCIVKAGLKAYETGKGKPVQTDEMKNKRIYHSREKTSDDYAKYLEGRNVKRYQTEWSGWWLKYGECLAAPRDQKIFTSPRILVRQIPSPPPYSINGVFTKDYWLNDINSMIVYDFKNVNPLFLLAVLNSRITTFWFVNTFDKFQRKIFPQFKVKELAIFPIPNASEQEQENIAKKAQLMLDLNKQLQKFGDKFTDERRKIESEIQKTDQEIDELVYKLYGLSEEEIKIVEENFHENYNS